ncbi:lysis system i-spanin subunit Rz [Burkholderia cepacia]|uniref:lysis system i-spanin subunit Rz n=1 Tax=Burkholderia cepacia TaxID=292 RepID=UPI001CF14957|nr:lysis system i-spanin subunit Rz [Burkholderia cepacia]MCA8351859.1 lysis protein [Burkholderia cepacia]
MDMKGILAAAAVVVLAGAALHYRAESGYACADAAAARAAHDRDMRAVAELAEQHGRELMAERERSSAVVAEIESKYQKGESDAKQAIDALRADVRAGDVRLRVAVANCSAGSDGMQGVGAAAGGSDGAGTAELDGTAADAFLDIAGDGDRAARKVAALQDFAREAIRVCGISQ